VNESPGLGRELDYVLLLFALFVVPRVLQRFRLPGAVTSVALGAVAGMGLGLFQGDATIHLLATLGIVALFLFAGLDVEFRELRAEAAVLTQHIVIRIVALAAVAAAAAAAFGLGWRPAVLVALALLTPSAGFVLDALGALDVTERERFWVRSKVIATELLALGVLFVTLQSTTLGRLALSTAILVALVALLPVVFRMFARWVVPFAPKSEFAFLLMVAVLAAFVTLRLGVYYLVGAFVVGITAQRFRERLPAIASEQMLHAVEVFASFFVPFYFFGAGLGLRGEDFSWAALLVGSGFVAALLPFRVAMVAAHRHVALGEPFRRGVRVAVPMLPTLVFTLVIAAILRDRFALPATLFGGLMIYAVVSTVAPGIVLRTPPPDFSSPHAPALALPPSGGSDG
jgi:Kef-type K+ transport system membrane component KefB